MGIPAGFAHIPGRNRATAKKLLDAAVEAGLDPSTSVRTVRDGYHARSEIVALVDFEAESDDVANDTEDSTDPIAADRAQIAKAEAKDSTFHPSSQANEVGGKVKTSKAAGEFAKGEKVGKKNPTVPAIEVTGAFGSEDGKGGDNQPSVSEPSTQETPASPASKESAEGIVTDEAPAGSTNTDEGSSQSTDEGAANVTGEKVDESQVGKEPNAIVETADGQTIGSDEQIGTLPAKEEPKKADTPVESEAPAGNAKRDDWAAYAEKIGYSADELADLSRDEIKALKPRKK